ncbi:XRE family transcriptional regulator [Cryobacterium sp. MLB-32]|uniref:helix-turn-helix transcriptional regulator n=1 Tax=Cryobacterium sp. MLB-32 TaxID=1529318 RepID=UPI0004E68800|nr:helix-turn-helix transcriptional regulator [Cryobacterium sp. MLB-32]KFF60109.1 XRE family transcriptional regulator [Cryobacterium sp. MLB-32]
MTSPTELGEFLRNRRSGLQPEDVGLQNYGVRRVPGLRREELAMLAGVSNTYYTRLEQGLSTNASASVLEAITRALGLNDAERAHLMNLANPAHTTRRTSIKPDQARAGTLRLINSMSATPAVVLGQRSEVLAWNALGHLLVGSQFAFDSPASPADRPNMTRMLFLDAHTQDLYERWREEATRAVASLRVLAGQFGNDHELMALVGELTMKSPEFAAMWAQHPVENCVSGLKFFRHPLVGALKLDFEVLTSPDNSGHRVLLYTAEPGSSSAEALCLLNAAGEVSSVPRGSTAH